VVAPTDLVSGGPESLHQLVDAIRRRGARAFISYHPFGKGAQIPEPYQGYDLERADPEDAAGNLVVIPESATGLVWEFQHATKAVWWLSVDNFFGPRPDSDEDYRRSVDTFETRTAKGEPTGRPTWAELASVLNWSQSAYSSAFLKSRELVPIAFPTTLNADFRRPPSRHGRRDVIAFNPKKGADVTARLMRRFPSFEWLPLTGLSRDGMREALETVKLYADFGFHPGRERIPQEAAMCGACVVTGRRGAAGYHADVPLPRLHRIDERLPWFEVQFGYVVRSIFRDFERKTLQLDSYRADILATADAFESAVDRELFV
jgi:hypothetical protein